MHPTSPKSFFIEQIELNLFEIDVDHVGTDPAGLGVRFLPSGSQTQLRLAVRIYCNQGIVGGYVPPRGRAKVVYAACEALAYGLIGEDPLQRDHLYQRMRRQTKHIGEVGIGPLDIALWDIAGKLYNAPIAQLLGGHRQSLKCYASTLGGDRFENGLCCAEAYADFAEQCLELGYPAYKTHGWHEGDVKEECAMLETVAKRVDGRMALMYDSSCHLTSLADAIAVGKVLDQYNYFWFEDPYSDGGISIQGHRRLKEFVKTPILITEFVRNPETTIDILLAGATDFARVDPDYDGGITGCYKAAVAAETLGLDTEVHACGPAMRHLMAALRLTNYYEVNLLHPVIGNAWHLPVYACDYSDDLDAVDEHGCVPVPTDPGLGVEYDWNYIERRTVASTKIA